MVLAGFSLPVRAVHIPIQETEAGLGGRVVDSVSIRPRRWYRFWCLAFLTYYRDYLAALLSPFQVQGYPPQHTRGVSILLG